MRRIVLPVLAAAATLAPAPALAADEVVTTVDRATPISAYGGGLLWSARNPATGRFRLMYTQPLTPPAPLPNVRERSVPFDADLGPGPDGVFLAVYSRCAREPRVDPLLDAGPPDYTTGRGCDLYQYDLLRKRETKLANASSATASEVLPTVWKRRLAFARRYDGQARTYLYERSRTGNDASRRMPAGSAGDGRYRARPTSVELYGRRLAFAWVYGGSGEAPGSQIRLDDTQTKAVTTVDDTGGGGLTTIQRATPSFHTAQLYYARLCKGDPGGCPGRSGIFRYRYSTADTFRAPIGRADLGITVGNRSSSTSITTYVLRDLDGSRACYDPTKGPESGATCQILATDAGYAPVG